MDRQPRQGCAGRRVRVVPGLTVPVLLVEQKDQHCEVVQCEFAIPIQVCAQVAGIIEVVEEVHVSCVEPAVAVQVSFDGYGFGCGGFVRRRWR